MHPVLLLICTLVPLAVSAQQKATIRVDASASGAALPPIWTFFGYDEPNYTYTESGRKLLAELSALGPAPVYIRMHNLLNSGDGTAAFKWGSTNVYTEDNAGAPVYDWNILDRIFDTLRDARVKPLVEIGFMPKALSTMPEPYRHDWPRGPLSTGWAYPPKNYGKWADLVYEWVRHAVRRYGADEVAAWYWEVWNEPDISYWRGTPEEYLKLYDFTADAVKRASPAARIGGPHSTSPSNPRAAAFLRDFLEHCIHGRNFATGAIGSPLDYVSFHAKGAPKIRGESVQMGMARQARDVSRGFEIVASFRELRGKPVIIGESDPEGCAACSARSHPENAYRNGPLYPCYTAVMLKNTLDLAARYGVNITGAVTWAFLFEDQPWFDGFRTLATNGVDKPVLNLFRMLGKMRGERIPLASDASVSLDAILEGGVRDAPDLDGLAARTQDGVSVLLWNYHDDAPAARAATVDLIISGLPASAARVKVRHYRIDETHSNAYTRWKQMGSPQKPSAKQVGELEAAGRLQPLEPARPLATARGIFRTEFALPRHATSLVELTWK